MSGFPIQPSKVQRPPLRDDVLSRARLNDLLDAKSSHRVVLVVAEAGYGKTTMLADWTRRTSRRVLWYRLDADDRDWLGFLHHIVAAGRTADDRFGIDVEEMLGSLGPEGPTRDQVVAALARALSDAASDGLTLILDDYHAVDDRADVREVLRGLVDRIADGVSILLSTRTDPELPLSRYRARAEVATLTAEDLRFDETELERLFREAYQRPLEPDILVDLAERTEGWAASLQLVRTAIRERTQAEVRSFVARLSGARGDLHDYLAEEVIGRLPDDLQQFLMRASLLEVISSETVAVVFRGTADQVEPLLGRAEGLGLLSRRSGPGSSYRFHPLVRDFLALRASVELGSDGVRELHLAVGEAFDGKDWRLASHHFLSAGEAERAKRSLMGSLEQVLARGEYAAAKRVLAMPPTQQESFVAGHVIESRLRLQRGDFAGARAEADRSVHLARQAPNAQLAMVVLNASGIHSSTHSKTRALELAREAAEVSADPALVVRAKAAAALQSFSQLGDTRELLETLEELRAHQIRNGEWHYVGITELNLAVVENWHMRPVDALRHSQEALEHLERSSKGYEAASVYLAKSFALGQLARWSEAEVALRQAIGSVVSPDRGELLAESALQTTWFGSRDKAAALIADLDQDDPFYRPLTLIVALTLALDFGEARKAAELAAELAGTALTTSIDAELFLTQLALARAGLRQGRQDAPELVRELHRIASAQGTDLGMALGRLLGAFIQGPVAVSTVLAQAEMSAPAAILASEIVEQIDFLDETAFAVVQSEVSRRPAKWLPLVRDRLRSAAPLSLRGLRLVELSGEPSDVAFLSSLRVRGRKNPASQAAAKSLANRIAHRVTIEDLGRIQVVVGERRIAGASIRRKVLALVAFLISQPRMAATRDQVLEAIWPDYDPSTALNSLNQTIYFLRRVLEPNYGTGSSPDYIYFEGETVWLDSVLVSTSSGRLRELASTAAGREAEAAAEALALYGGRFALDFAYEEWAIAYREGLHSSFLGLIEAASSVLESHGQTDRAIAILRQALELDSEADALELRLLRLYRRTESHAAAAEQYAHYSSVLRDELGIEPPPLDSI